MNYELETVWKEVVMVSFKVLFCHLIRGTEENYVRTWSGSPASDQRFELGTSLRYEAGLLSTQP